MADGEGDTDTNVDLSRVKREVDNEMEIDGDDYTVGFEEWTTNELGRRREEKRVFVCNVCEMTWEKKSGLSNHKRTHGVYYVCLICEEDCRNTNDDRFLIRFKKDLESHFAEHHDEEEFPKAEWMMHISERYHETELVDLTDDAEEIKTKLAQKQGQIISLEGELEVKEGHVQNLRALLQEKDVEIASLVDGRRELEATTNEFRERLETTHKAVIPKLHVLRKDLRKWAEMETKRQAKLVRYKNNFSRFHHTLLVQEEAAQMKLDRMKAYLTRKTVKLAETVDEISKLREDFKKKEYELNEKDKRLSFLSSSLSQVKSILSERQGELQKLKGERNSIFEIEWKYYLMEKETDKRHRSEMAQLQRLLDETNERLKSEEEAVKKVEEKNQELKEMLDCQINHVRQVEKRNEELKRTNAHLNSRITRISEEFGGVSEY